MLVTLCFSIALVPLLWVLFEVIIKGVAAVVSATWWTKSLQGILPEQFGGGVYHAIYGTLVQAFIAAIIAVPLGLMIAIYLVEYGRGRLAQVTTSSSTSSPASPRSWPPCSSSASGSRPSASTRAPLAVSLALSCSCSRW